MTDPRNDAIVQAAASRVQAAVSDALDRLALQTGPLAMAATSNLQRQLLMNVDGVLRRQTPRLNQAFARALIARLQKTFGGRDDGHGAPIRLTRDADWTALTQIGRAHV